MPISTYSHNTRLPPSSLTKLRQYSGAPSQSILRTFYRPRHYGKQSDPRTHVYLGSQVF
jgi:hypothetical protein